MAKITSNDDKPFLDASSFLSKFNNEQKKKIQETAIQCKNDYKKANSAAWILLPVCLFGGVVAALLTQNYAAIIWGAIFGFVLSGAIHGNAVLTAKKKFASSVVPDVVRAVYGENSVFDVNHGWDKEYLAKFNLFGFGNVYTTDSLLKGAYKDVPFTVANVTSGNRTTDSKGHSSTTYYFNGLVAVYHFNKEFPGSLEIREEEAGAGFSRNFPYNQRIDLEDIVFNKQFNVYADDKESAFYVITPQFIEAFKEIKRRVPGTLIFCIQSDRLIIAINGAKNSFDFDVKNSEPDILVQKMIEEILPFRWFIDIFNLEDDYGKNAVAKAKQEALNAAETIDADSAGDKLESKIENGLEETSDPEKKVEDVVDSVSSKGEEN
jgi:hypothetical protein